MMIIILLFLAIIFAIGSRKMYSSIVNPLFIFVVVNMLSIVLSLMMDSFSGYSDSMMLYISIMFISFFIGIKLGNDGSFNQTETFIPSSKENFNKLFKIIFITSILYDFALLFYLQNLFSKYTLVQFFTDMGEVNKYVQSDDYKSGWFSYIVALGTPLAILILHYARNTKWNAIIAFQFVLCFLHCLSPRRSDMFNFIIIVGFYLLNRMQNNENPNRKKQTKKIVLTSLGIAVAFVAIMVYSQELLGKNATDSISVLGYTIPPALVDPYTYFALNYPYADALGNNELVSCDVPFQSSLRLLYIILNGFGFTHIDTQTPFALDFLWFGETASNTAPMLYYAFKDLGYLFFLVFILLGFVSQKAYYAMNSSSITKKIYACFVYSLLLLSFRSYIMIFLSFALALFYIFIFDKLLTKK